MIIRLLKSDFLSLVNNQLAVFPGVGYNKAMRIGWDVSAIPYGTGVSRYTTNLVRALVRLYPQEDYVLFGGSFRQLPLLKSFASSLPSMPQIKYYPLPPKLSTLLFNKWHLSIEWFMGNLDIFHSWDWYTPKVTSGKLVTTIHDLSAIKFPNDTNPKIVRQHRMALEWIKKETAAVIAVSETTKKDIVSILSIEEKRIHVVYEALSEESKVKIVKSEVDNVKKKYSISKPYILAVLSFEPRKNIRRLISAWRKLQNDFDLVLVGKSGYETVESKEGIIVTGYVEGKTLAALYAGAICLAYPSLYEGFGLPILEAFYYEVPVVTSNVSSMPEVA